MTAASFRLDPFRPNAHTRRHSSRRSTISSIERKSASESSPPSRSRPDPVHSLGFVLGSASPRDSIWLLVCHSIGISTLEATALGFSTCATHVVAVIGAGRGRLVWASYQASGARLEQLRPPRNGTVSELARSYAGPVPCS